MFNVTISKSERTTLDSDKVKLYLKDRISLVQKITDVTSVRVAARKLVG